MAASAIVEIFYASLKMNGKCRAFHHVKNICSVFQKEG